MENFADYIAAERNRLNAERYGLLSEQEELQRKIAAVDREMVAINAYEAAKTGKSVSANGAARVTRARKGSRREELVNVIRQSPTGLARREIIEMLGVKGDKSGEMSISNALTALTKTQQLARQDGRYVVQQAA